LKNALRYQNKIPEATKIIQQGDSTLKENNASYLAQNDREITKERILQSEQQSNGLSEDYKSPQKTAKPIEESSIISNQNEAQNSPNFITLSKIPEQDRIEIIQTGFQLQSEGPISLKKYYESTDP
jgi:hypothetical protein